MREGKEPWLREAVACLRRNRARDLREKSRFGVWGSLGVGRGGGWGCGSPWHRRAVLCAKDSDAQTVPAVGVCTAGSRLRYGDLASSTLGAARIRTAPGCLLLVQRPYVACFFSPGSKIKKSEWGSVGGLPALPATLLTLLVLTVFCFSSSSQKWGQYNIWMQGGGKITWAAFSMPACRQLFSLLCNNFQHNCWFLQCLLTSLDCVVNSLHFIH